MIWFNVLGTRDLQIEMFADCTGFLKALFFFVTERTLEDHEYVLAAYKDLMEYPKTISFRFMFRQDFDRYEFFDNAQVSLFSLFRMICTSLASVMPPNGE